MFAGKSTELQRLAVRYRIAGRHVLVVKPRMDSRYDTATITTHAGAKIPALCLEKVSDIVATGPTMVICIDEGHMFPGMRVGFPFPLSTRPPLQICPRAARPWQRADTRWWSPRYLPGTREARSGC
jgi:hypothetical protein